MYDPGTENSTLEKKLSSGVGQRKHEVSVDWLMVTKVRKMLPKGWGYVRRG